jgi:hypothetical protein
MFDPQLRQYVWQRLTRCAPRRAGIVRTAKQCVWRSRCQARGGPRARTRSGREDVGSELPLNARRAAATGRGSGSETAAGGTPAPAMWITAQMAQWSMSGLSGTRGPSIGATWPCAVSRGDAAELALPCTWPNVSASWSAIATSAHHAPTRTFVRNQRMFALTACASLEAEADRHGHGDLAICKDHRRRWKLRALRKRKRLLVERG